MKATLRIYEQQLEDLPAEDVKTVLQKFGRGNLGDGHWCPTPAEIRREVESVMAYRARQDDLDRGLRKQIEDRREREERIEFYHDVIKDGMVALSDALKSGIDSSDVHKPYRQPTKEEALDWVAAHEGGAGLPPVTEFSDSLREILEGMRKPREAAE